MLQRGIAFAYGVASASRQLLATRYECVGGACIEARWCSGRPSGSPLLCALAAFAMLQRGIAVAHGFAAAVRHFFATRYECRQSVHGGTLGEQRAPIGGCRCCWGTMDIGVVSW
jgi:hypothetical protein